LPGPERSGSDVTAQPDYGTYDPNFHDSTSSDAHATANRVLPLTFHLVDVESVVDVGCGYGDWLAAAGDLGVPVLVGIEGEWGAAWRDRGVLDSRIELVLCDLERPIAIERRFDLAICLEVAEHLSHERGPGLVADLCLLAPSVLFSAAVPRQGGDNHINEQPLSVWVREFAAQGYRPLDVIRRRLWDDEEIPFWYRQNLILFVTSERWDEAASRAAALAPLDDVAGVDILHPRLTLSYIGQIESLSRIPPLPEPSHIVIPALPDSSQIGVRTRVRLAVGLPSACLRAVRRRWAQRKLRKLDR
jgi:SAM-dependent methyltransferase